MPKKKKSSVSSNRKYHYYRKHKITPKPLQPAANNSVIISPQDVNDFTSVKLSIKLRDDFIPQVHVHNKHLPIDHDICKSVPQTLQSVEQLVGFLQNFSKYEVCTGNFDQEFQDIIPLCSVSTHPKSREISAFRESDMGASHENFRYISTIRSVNCKLLCLKSTKQWSSRWKACCIYRCSLKSIKSRRERIKNRKET
ncbi:unnamed protein product [Mytilus coruscus]|uniref:Uncharacterized protein n=1 Tax=Mytilus coruscus TaxID=42192 RepID=A0A6J8DVN4_MYTCO|nr:unnamed protein product [Mytilus coruscus]